MFPSRGALLLTGISERKGEWALKVRGVVDDIFKPNGAGRGMWCAIGIAILKGGDSSAMLLPFCRRLSNLS